MPQAMNHVMLLVICVLTRCAALYLQPEQTGRLAAHDAEYIAAMDAWDVRLVVRENSIVIPQLGTVNMSCVGGGSVLMKCEDLTRLTSDDAWRNADAGGSVCSLQSKQEAQAVQERVMCVLEDFVCVLFPSGLRIKNNASDLERYGGPARELVLRLLHVTHVANAYMVHTQCLRVKTSAPLMPASALSVSNTCVKRGLEAPTFSSMRESGGVCVWYCVVGRVRWAWHSDPPPNASAARHSHVCRPVPPDFVAVEFVLKLELSLSSVVPRLLQRGVLQWLDTVANLTEHHMQQHSGVSGFITVLSIPDSVYHTNELSTIAPDVIRARQAEYDSIALQAWRFRRSFRESSGTRRRLGSTDVTVHGLHLMPAMPLSDATWLLLTEQAMEQVLKATPPPETEGVLQLRLASSTKLHRRKVAMEPPAEVLFSDVDILVLCAALFIVLSYCVYAACCDLDVARRAYRRCVLTWFG